MRKKGEGEGPGRSYLHPGAPKDQPSQIYPKSQVYTVPYSPPKQQPYQQAPNINPYLRNSYEQNNPNSSSQGNINLPHGPFPPPNSPANYNQSPNTQNSSGPNPYQQNNSQYRQ